MGEKMSGGGSKPGERRGGRKKGATNKITRDLKDMILGALDEAGGAQYLAAQADKNPSAFLALIGKILPLQVTGPGDGPLKSENKWTVEIIHAGNPDTK